MDSIPFIYLSIVDRKKGFIHGEEISVGYVHVMRYRKGTDTNWTYVLTWGIPIYSPTTGVLYFNYDFPSSNWQSGDFVKAYFAECEIYGGLRPIKIPEIYLFTKVT